MKPISILALLIFSTCYVFFNANQAIASPLPSFPFVTVTGSAEKEVTPDMAVLNFEVRTFDQNSEIAYQRLTQTSQLVIELLQKSQIDEDAIEAYEIDKQIRYNRDRNNPAPEIVGYDFSRDWQVEISDLKIYATLLKAFMEMDNVHNVNATFDVSNRDEFEIELITQATAKAKSKAEQMAKGLGVELGDVFAFNDSGSFSSFFATFGLQTDARYERISVTGMRMDMQMMQGNDIFIPKYITLNKTINVLCRIDN